MIQEHALPLRRGHVRPTAGYGHLFDVGPSLPLMEFPPALFTKALFTAQRLVDLSHRELLREPKAQLRYLTLVALILNFNRDHEKYGSFQPGPASIKYFETCDASSRVRRLYLDIGGNLCLDPFITNLSENASPLIREPHRIFLGPLASHPLSSRVSSVPAVHLADDVLYQQLEIELARALTPPVTHENRAATLSSDERHFQSELVDGLFRTIRNSPYNKAAAIGSTHKLRYKIIDALEHSSEAGAFAQLKVYLERHPRLLKTPGWCGGTMLHTTSRRGNISLLLLLIERSLDAHVLRKLRVEKRDLLEWKDEDGCTPLHIAVRNNRGEAKELLLKAGADPRAINCYGQMACPDH